MPKNERSLCLIPKGEAREKPIIGHERYKGNIVHRVTDIGLLKYYLHT